MPAEMFYDSDADLSVIQGRKVAVIGYGCQGHAHALSLRDSGVDVRVGLQPRVVVAGPRPRRRACGCSAPYAAAEEADLIMVLAPDQAQRNVYAEEIAPNLQDGRRALLRATASTSASATSSRRRASTCAWSPRRARATWCAASTPRAAASR